MILPGTSDGRIEEIGAEPLEGSGFDTEDAVMDFESYEPSAEEGINQ